jgi:hypothetical protein
MMKSVDLMREDEAESEGMIFRGEGVEDSRGIIVLVGLNCFGGKAVTFFRAPP